MKTSRATFDRALDRPDPSVRFYLFYGQDEAQSRGFADRLLNALGAEKVVIAAAAAKADPALLATEASAIGLFGGRQALWVEPASDDIAPAVEALLEAPAVESPVIAIAGPLRKTSSLVKLAEAHGQALAHISYDLDPRDAERLVDELARPEGLRLASGIAARIAAAAANDRGVIAQELVKIALYTGATTDDPRQVDRETLDAIGSGAEANSMRLGDIALSGDVERLSTELEAAAADVDAITVLRALQRRLLMLAPIRSKVERGQRPHDAVASAGKAVFWKEKEAVTRLVSLWDSAALARAMERSGRLERGLMRSDSPPQPEALEEELLEIARMARRK